MLSHEKVLPLKKPVKKSDTCMCNAVLKAEWQDYKVKGFPFKRCYLGRILIPKEFRERKKTKYKQKPTTSSKNKVKNKVF